MRRTKEGREERKEKEGSRVEYLLEVAVSELNMEIKVKNWDQKNEMALTLFGV